MEIAVPVFRQSTRTKTRAAQKSVTEVVEQEVQQESGMSEYFFKVHLRKAVHNYSTVRPSCFKRFVFLDCTSFQKQNYPLLSHTGQNGYFFSQISLFIAIG